MAFPDGDYTPFGYLRNPSHRAWSWDRCEGGNLRTADATLGLEWVYPWHGDPALSAGISVVALVGGRRCQSREDYAALGYTSRYHSANMLGFDWDADEVEVRARYLLVGEALCVHILARNRAAWPRRFRMQVCGRVASREQMVEPRSSGPAGLFTVPAGGSGPSVHALLIEPAGAAPLPPVPLPDGGAGEIWAGAEVDLVLAPGRRAEVAAALGRGQGAAEATAAARQGLGGLAERMGQVLAEDEAFYAHCPLPRGDWPAGWREGFVYDLETTRLCLMPPIGIYTDVWPSWMAAWPRGVLAEGTLDMLRLGYADPEAARRAVLTLFRDTPGDNLPCVFPDGTPNMVARDGSRCGTSPAWCLPFLNLELLYLRTLDRAWLGALFPFLARYLDWWLEHRTDPRGWVVYKCTWEAGEDGNPRLDPERSGDRDISAHLRPVELQAALAHAAGVLAFFAGELGLAGEQERWWRVWRRYQQRTRRLFDPAVGRFRDWLIAEQCFQEPRPDDLYWGVDSRRFSPLSLMPLLGGIASPAQAQALRQEVERHRTAPWLWWPSWTHTLVECAAAARMYAQAGEIAFQTIDRVYRQNGRRALAGQARPTPGAAREYWPQDLRDWSASDAYGWGATTANLLVRHLFGLHESRETGGWVLELCPALPPAWVAASGRYGLDRCWYRGTTFDLAYTGSSRGLEVELQLPAARFCLVRGPGPRSRLLYRSRRPAARHEFVIANGQPHRLELWI